MKEYLVVGGNGLIGSALKKRWGDNCDVSRKDNVPGTLHLDLMDDPLVWPFFPRYKAAVICANTVNPERVLTLVDELVSGGAFVVFLSSNRVFDGSKPIFNRNDPLCPVDEYGANKAVVERELWQWHPHVAIVRITKVLHWNIPIVDEWKKALLAGNQITAWTNQHISPVILDDVVAAISKIAENSMDGIWQLSGAKDLPWSKVALAVCGKLQRDSSVLVKCVHKGDCRYATLDASDAARELGFPVRSGREALRLAI